MSKKKKKAAPKTAKPAEKAAAMVAPGADGELVPVVEKTPELLVPGPDGELPKV